MNDMTMLRPVIHAPLSFRTRSGGAPAKSNSFAICPVCDAPMSIRSSQRETECIKSLSVICSNPGCGMTGGAQFIFIDVWSPSLIDRPDLNLKHRPKHLVPHIFPPPKDDGTEANQISMFSD